MPTFPETVLALTPLIFARGKDLSGDQVTDYSGNDYHLPITGVGILLGQASPVETDPEARSIYCPGGFANHIARLEDPPAPLLFTGNFTIALFVKHQETSGFQYLFARGGSAGSSVDGLQLYTNGLSTRTLAVAFVTDDGVNHHSVVVTAEISHLNEVDYMVGVTRNGNVVRLWMNAEVVGEETGADTNPLEIDSSNDIVFGAGGNNLAPLKGWASELMVFDYAITQGDWTAIYESAISATFLSGVSNVIPTGILDSSEDPDPINFPFRHNWASDLIERISFQTSISQAKSGPEEATEARSKPRREIEINQLLRDDTERASLRAKLWANQHAKWFIPILEDREIIEAQSAAETTFGVSTLYKDYEIGGWFHIRALDTGGRITQSEYHQIASFTEDGVTTLTGLENDFSGHVEACPARRGIVTVSSPRGHTDAVEDLVITAELLAEDEQTTPNRITPWTPVITYKGFELFKESVWQTNDWSDLREFGVDRNLRGVDFETGVSGVESDTPGNQESFSYRIWIKGRDLNASFLGWFYDRSGSGKYLWAPSMQKDFTITGTGLNTVTVSGTIYSDNYGLAEARRDLAFVYNDGSVTARRVTAFEKDTAEETLTLSTTVPTLANLRSLSLLKFCRLDADTLEIAKRTDDVWIYAWRFRELLTSPV